MNILISDLQKADIFEFAFQNMKLFTNSINITFSDTGLYIQSMDTANVSMFELKIPKEWFNSYEKTEGETFTLGVNPSIMSKIFSVREKHQSVKIVLDESKSDVLNIFMECDIKTVFDKNFEIPLMDIECELLEIPDVDYDAELVIQSASFANTVSQLKQFGDIMDIACSENEIKFVARSQENGKMVVIVDINDLVSFSINEGAELDLSFSIRYIHMFCLYKHLSETVELKFSQNIPLMICYNIGDNASMKFFLAPKIKDDE
jgi:proliferating cell nuclear antigen